MVTYSKIIDMSKTSVSLISGKIVGCGCRALNINDLLKEVGKPDLTNSEQVLFYSWLPLVKEVRVVCKDVLHSDNRVELLFDDATSPVILYNTNLESELIKFIHKV